MLNSKNYGICFFDLGFRPNSNQIIRKFVVFLLNQVENDEFLANLVDNCLRTCPDLLSTVWKTISNEFGLKNEKFVEILQEQKKLTEWNEISMSFDEIRVEKNDNSVFGRDRRENYPSVGRFTAVTVGMSEGIGHSRLSTNDSSSTRPSFDFSREFRGLRLKKH